ncbi:MAG: DegT/DnrJ/EryC1/StrS family aminotransferase [Myxococcota bacterium]|nr:DegT/DnrJ/EryC1/StrS family aminotransferase [Myxococcota bacterium]
MRIPILDLKAQVQTYRTDVLAAITRVVDHQQFIMGDEVKAFESKLAKYADVSRCLGVSSGTDALLAALMGLDIGVGDKVLTTPFSFFSTAGVVARLGAVPVFVDIDPQTYNLNSALIEAALTDDIRAIIPVHLYGQMADIADFANRPGRPPIVEDAAQALGARLHGKMTGHYGDCACVSFFPSKNLGGFGDGGGLLVQNQEFADKLSILRLHGAKPKYHHHIVGGNFRLDAIQAAILGVKLPHLDSWADSRRHNAHWYNEALCEAGLVSRGLVTTPLELPDATHVYNQYVLRATRRDELRVFLGDRGIGTMVYYPKPLHVQPCFKHLGYGPGDFPHAERAAESVLAIPVYPELTREQQQFIVDSIADFYGVG